MRTVAIPAFIATAALVPVEAAQLGVYAGGFYAQTDRDADPAEFAVVVADIYEATGFTPLQTSASFDVKDNAYGFLVGYRMFEHFAIEGGYVDLGEVSYRDRSSGVFADEPGNWLQNLNSSTSGIALSVLGILPVTYRWELYGRAGVLLASNENSLFIADNVRSPGRASVTKSGFDMLAGVGMSLSFAEIYNLRLEFQRVFDAGESETLAEADVDVLSLGVTVSF